jgi:transcriptional regulator with XRE-family HTH domain
MDSVNERLRLFFEKNKIDQAGTAKKLNVSPQRLNNWLTETSIPMYSLSDLLNLFENLDGNWLLIGKTRLIANDNYTIAEEPPYIY